MEISHGYPEENSAERAEHGVTEIAMQRRHRSRLDFSAKAIADDEVGTRIQRAMKAGGGEAVKFVAVVRVGHKDIASARAFDAGHERRAVSANRNMDYARAFGGRNLERAVRAAIVGDDYFAGKTAGRDCGERLANADGEGLRLIEAWHHDCHRNGARVGIGRQTRSHRVTFFIADSFHSMLESRTLHGAGKSASAKNFAGGSLKRAL